MDDKKWPTSGKWIIGIWCFLGVKYLINGFWGEYIIYMIIGSLIFVMSLGLYNFRPWARLGAIIIGSILLLLELTNGIVILVMRGICTLYFLHAASCVSVIVYLNTIEVKKLFCEERKIIDDTRMSCGNYSRHLLNNMNFEGKKLSGVSFRNARLENINFRNADLRGADFTYTSLKNCDLRGALVAGASFINAIFPGTKIGGVDFSSADMTHSNTSEADHATDIPISAKLIQSSLVDASLAKIDLAINFDYNKDTLKPQGMQQLAELGTALKSPSFASSIIRIEVYTDSTGSDEYNLDLSYRRAARIVRVLTEQYGVKNNLLNTKGYGKSKPIADNSTEFGRAQNRRVTIVNTSIARA